MKRLITQYKNGIKHIHYEIPFLKSVSAIYHVLVGSGYERDDSHFGASHFLEHMLFNGSDKYPDFSKRDEYMASLGVYQNAWTSRNSTGYYIISSKESFPKAFDTLHDLLFYPLILPEHVEKERGIIQEERLMSENEPESVLYERVWGELNRGNSYAHPVIGTKESIENMSLETLKGFHSTYYAPNNTILITYGGIGGDEIEGLLSDHLQSVKRISQNQLEMHELSSSFLVFPEIANDEMVVKLEKDVDVEYYQRHHRSFEIVDLQELLYAYLMNVALAYGQTSILNRRLKYEDPIVSDYWFGVRKLKGMTQIIFDSEQERGKTNQVVEILNEVLSDLPDLMDNRTFERAKNMAFGSIVRSVEDVGYPLGNGMLSIEVFNYLTGTDHTIDDLLVTMKALNLGGLKDFTTRILSESRYLEGVLTPKGS